MVDDWSAMDIAQKAPALWRALPARVRSSVVLVFSPGTVAVAAWWDGRSALSGSSGVLIAIWAAAIALAWVQVLVAQREAESARAKYWASAPPPSEAPAPPGPPPVLTLTPRSGEAASVEVFNSGGTAAQLVVRGRVLSIEHGPSATDESLYYIRRFKLRHGETEVVRLAGVDSGRVWLMSEGGRDVFNEHVYPAFVCRLRIEIHLVSPTAMVSISSAEYVLKPDRQVRRLTITECEPSLP